MRSALFILLLAIPLLSIGKRPNSYRNTAVTYEKHSLFDGNLLMDIPLQFKKDREYRHFWDKCDGGGYTVAFKGPRSKFGSMNVQVSIHDYSTDPEHMHEGYDPRKQLLENSQVLEDSSYIRNGQRYHVIATVNKKEKAFSRKANYTLNYYIVANGKMLEYHYYYWHKDGLDLNHWQTIAQQMANSISWRSTGWAKN